MIQRIQTIFLLLISIASGIGFFFLPPLNLSYFGLPVHISLESYLILSGSIAFLTLILFKKRKIQLMINRIHIVLQIILFLFLAYGLINSLNINTFLMWSIMPFLYMILLLLTSKAIRKDEDLIRSIDRLR